MIEENEVSEENTARDEPTPELIVTDEVRDEIAAEAELARKKAIRKHLSGNLGDKTERVAEINADRRNPRTQPDFEDDKDEE